MAEVLRDYDDDDGMEYLETMVKKGHHAVDITRQARDLTETMLESEFGTDRIPLKSTLETQIEEIRSTYSQAIITVEGEIPSTAVVADGMLASVFRNILANGIQHNDSAVPQIRVWVQTADERLTVHIADNGPGIPDDRKDEIFGRGEKGLKSSGTGLGLYLVDTLVDRYSGNVSVTDSDDGAEFVIRLLQAEE
jgi:signal transduction histidine kinase